MNFNKIEESKQKHINDQRKLSFAEKLEVMCDIQEKQYFMNKNKMKHTPWRIKDDK